jgi:hypothetical protein
MKRSARNDDGKGEGRQPVPARSNGEGTPPGPLYGNALAGGRRYFRGQATRLLGEDRPSPLIRIP